MGQIHRDHLSLKSMPRMSHALMRHLRDTVSMSRKPPSAYNAQFIARVKEAREAANFTQVQIATVLGITQDQYKQYETRSLLPHRYIAQFCAATRISEAWLISGNTSAKRSTTSAQTA